MAQIGIGIIGGGYMGKAHAVAMAAVAAVFDTALRPRLEASGQAAPSSSLWRRRSTPARWSWLTREGVMPSAPPSSWSGRSSR